MLEKTTFLGKTQLLKRINSRLSFNKLVAVLLMGILIACVATSAAVKSLNQKHAALNHDFKVFISNLWPEAKTLGVSRDVFETAFKDISLDWSLPDLDPSITGAAETLAQQQAEFGNPARYFNTASIKALTTKGQALSKTWGKTLKRIEKHYGVPAGILLAIWARESNYGRAAIPYDAVRSLATLSFMGRRQNYFRPELLAALVILQQGHIPRTKMQSSWAGAMGHMQMLPSQFLSHAVDFDGDGRKDIIGSVPDALASTANLLRSRGWQSKQAWGYEVILPEHFECTLEGPDAGRSLNTWLQMGIKTAVGHIIPPARRQDIAFLILPAARFGPAFLGTHNYYVIKSYNESDLYTIFIGHLANQITGNLQFSAPWENINTYTRAEVAALQRKLVTEGYQVGDSIDGLIGFRTRIATGQYQKKYGLSFNCWPGPEVFKHAKVNIAK